MGMFDTIIVEGLKLKTTKEVTSFLKANNAELPNEFQTKDLDNALTTYRINAKGDVFEDVSRPTGKKVPYVMPFADWNDKRPWLEKVYWNIKNKKYNALEEARLVDELKKVKIKSKVTNTVTMLSYDEIGGRFVTLDYEIKIVNGKVKSNKLLRWEIEDRKEADERYNRDIEFKKKMDSSFIARRAFQSKWYYPVLKETYNPFIYFSRLAVQSICNALIRWSYRWTGV